MVRFRAEDESGTMKEWDVSYEEFERLIGTGEADPDLEVCSVNLTQGQWKRLGDTTLYKKAAAAREGGGSLGLRDIVERTHVTETPNGTEGGKTWTCGGCGKENQKSRAACWYCNEPRGAGTVKGSTVAPIVLPVSDQVPSRYGALRTIAGVYKVLAWLAAIVCVIGAIISIAAAQKMARSGYGSGAGGLGFVGVLAYLIAGAVGFVSFYAAAEGILVFLDIEENTRATRSLARSTLEAISGLAARPANHKD